MCAIGAVTHGVILMGIERGERFESCFVLILFCFSRRPLQLIINVRCYAVTSFLRRSRVIVA